MRLHIEEKEKYDYMPEGESREEALKRSSDFILIGMRIPGAF